jgi:hypothetical protein
MKTWGRQFLILAPAGVWSATSPLGKKPLAWLVELLCRPRCCGAENNFLPLSRIKSLRRMVSSGLLRRVALVRTDARYEEIPSEKGSQNGIQN